MTQQDFQFSSFVHLTQSLLHRIREKFSPENLPSSSAAFFFFFLENEKFNNKSRKEILKQFFPPSLALNCANKHLFMIPENLSKMKRQEDTQN